MICVHCWTTASRMWMTRKAAIPTVMGWCDLCSVHHVLCTPALLQSLKFPFGRTFGELSLTCSICRKVGRLSKAKVDDCNSIGGIDSGILCSVADIDIELLCMLLLSGLLMHATILAYMFSLVEMNKITCGLGPNVQAAQNMTYIQQFLANLLKTAFPHLNKWVTMCRNIAVWTDDAHNCHYSLLTVQRVMHHLHYFPDVWENAVQGN